MYSREKTLAIVTGLVSALIFLAGTALGSYHAITTIGVLAGLLATGCYIIGDVAMIWAAFIDYHEDRNAMEWASWGVKYGLSFYLLFSGGCIAYTLFNDSATTSSRNAAVQRANDAQASCLKAGGKPVACRKTFEAALAGEREQDSTKESKRVKWVDDFVSFPLFNYLPGILGLLSLLVLTFVSKLNREDSGGDFDFGDRQVKFATGAKRANFTLPRGTRDTLPAVTNGAQSFRFKPQGNRYALNWRSAGRERYGVMVTEEKARALSGLSYADVAGFVVAHRLKNDPGDGLSQEIKATV